MNYIVEDIISVLNIFSKCYAHMKVNETKQLSKKRSLGLGRALSRVGFPQVF